MALKRLLLGISVLSILWANDVFAQIPSNAQIQIPSATADQDGILLMDGLGSFYSAPLGDDNIGPFIFWNLDNQRIGFASPLAKDLEWVADSNGKPIGAYLLDVYGGQHTLNVVRKLEDLPKEITGPALLSVAPAVVKVPTPVALGANHPLFTIPPYWGFDVAQSLRIAPDWRETTFGYKGYFVLDNDGVVHPLGATNLPQYAFMKAGSEELKDATFWEILFPESIDTSGSSVTPEQLLKNGPITYPVNGVLEREYDKVKFPELWQKQHDRIIHSVTPIITYFGPGSDIARGLEISVEYAEMTVPSKRIPGVTEENRKIAMTNGYYILDGFGAVHSCRLPLDFDTDGDGKILYTDMYKDFENGVLNPDFGKPINNAVLSAPWDSDRGNLPYFGVDIAVDVKITPSGKGFYLLDAYGGIFAIGDAHFSFPPRFDAEGKPVKSISTTPFFGFPIARSLALVPNAANPVLGLGKDELTIGYVVLDGFGTVHAAGLAETYKVSETGNKGKPIAAFSDSFRKVMTTPVWLPQEPPITSFVVGQNNYSVDVAPHFKDVTGAFTTISAPK